jgi:HK97 family phage major capsid protein
MPNINDLNHELQTLVAQMRARVETEGDDRTAPGLTREAFERMDKRIDQLQDSLNEVTKRALRTQQAGEEQAQRNEEETLRRNALMTYLRRGDQRLTAAERDALDRLQRALSVDSDPDGGFVVTPELSDRISTIIFETSPVRSVATVQTITTDALEGLFDGDEASFGWIAERGSRTETNTPQLGQWRIPTHELFAAPRATQKLLDDAYLNMEAWLTQKVADRLARAENTAFVSGNGVDRPRGFMTYPAGTNRGQIQQLPSLDANTISSEGLVNIVYALKSGYRQGAVWGMARSTVGVIRRIRDNSGATVGTGQFMWSPGFGTQPQSLMGFPIVEMEDMPTVAGSALPVAFGNFAQAYTIVDRQGTRVLRDPYSAKPFVEFYTTRRVGGDVVNFEALKIMVVSAS